MKDVICQSCAMPMPNENLYGTKADGTKTDEYCAYCYSEGEFVNPSTTLEEMVAVCVPHIVSEDGMTEAEATKMMQKVLPTLKRWRA